jgi:Transketolase
MPITDEVRKLAESKPFYAVAGAGDFAVEKLRELPAQVRELTARREELRQTAQERAREYAGAWQSKAEAYAKDLPEKAREYADAIAQKAAALYDEFATRGRKVVSRVSGEAALELEEVSEAAEPAAAIPAPPQATATARKAARRPKPKA